MNLFLPNVRLLGHRNLHGVQYCKPLVAIVHLTSSLPALECDDHFTPILFGC